MELLAATKRSLLLGLALSACSLFAAVVPVAADSAHGIVPIGSTNEGGSGIPNGPKTGILDITAGPCVGMVSVTDYQRLSTLITLRRGTKLVAEWRIFGEQRIAWVEPVGKYEVHSNQSTVTRALTIRVTASRPTVVKLMPACK